MFPSAAEDAQMTICKGGGPCVCPSKYDSRVNLVTTLLCFGWRAVWIEVMYRNGMEIIRYQIGRKVTDSSCERKTLVTCRRSLAVLWLS